MRKYTFYIVVFGLWSLVLAGITYATRLNVPFTSQAPEGIWKRPWDMACEEATTAMIDLYYSGYDKEKIDVAKAKENIMRLVRIENNYLGFNKDTNANQIVDIINKFLPWEARVVENPTLEQMRAELDAGRPLIAPTHARLLNNKYYNSGHLDYHVFVIIGYDDNTKEFIAHDPGTGKGLDYRYPYDTIMDALHDFLPPNNTVNGRKAVIFTNKYPTSSKDTDGDNDGLNKGLELAYGTALWLTDSDGDGYSDGHEVISGYSPTVDETKLEDGTLVKAPDNPSVYLIEQGKKRKITNMEVFKAHGWKWNQVRGVSSKFIELKLESGEAIVN